MWRNRPQSPDNYWRWLARPVPLHVPRSVRYHLTDERIDRYGGSKHERTLQGSERSGYHRTAHHARSRSLPLSRDRSQHSLCADRRRGDRVHPTVQLDARSYPESEKLGRELAHGAFIPISSRRRLARTAKLPDSTKRRLASTVRERPEHAAEVIATSVAIAFAQRR